MGPPSSWLPDLSHHWLLLDVTSSSPLTLRLRTSQSSSLMTLPHTKNWAVPLSFLLWCPSPRSQCPHPTWLFLPLPSCKIFGGPLLHLGLFNSSPFLGGPSPSLYPSLQDHMGLCVPSWFLPTTYPGFLANHSPSLGSKGPNGKPDKHLKRRHNLHFIKLTLLKTS